MYIWSLAWWPHALLHGENPFYTHVLWAPNGANLAWATSIPTLAIPLTPVTLAFGPVLSYNVACILMPALDAWAAFLLCRALTRRTLPSLVGGYLFGFSSYVLAGELSHVHSAAVFPLPLGALLILRFWRHELGARAFALLFGGLVALQLGLSTEILLQLTIVIAIGLLLAFAILGGWRRHVLELVPPLIAAYAFAGVVALPFVYYLLSGNESPPNPGAQSFTADLANFVVPTKATVGGWWSGDIASHFPGNDVERGAYLGLPALVIVVLFAVRARRNRGTRLLALIPVVVLLSLGSWFTVDGHRLFRLPWAAVAHRSVFVNVMPVRFAVFCVLIVAVVVALWISSRPAGSRLRLVLPSLAVLAVVPNLAWRGWACGADVPMLFRTEAVRHCIPQNANVIVFPSGPRGDSMIWQAESGFWFRIAGGYITPSIPASFLHPAEITHLTTNDHPSEITVAAVRELARIKGVSAVVLDSDDAAVWAPILRPLGKPQAVGGTLIYRLRDKSQAAACSMTE